MIISEEARPRGTSRVSLLVTMGLDLVRMAYQLNRLNSGVSLSAPCLDRLEYNCGTVRSI